MTAAPADTPTPNVPADLAAALAWGDIDIAAAIGALRSLALTTVAAVAGEAPADRDVDALERAGRRPGRAGSLSGPSFLARQRRGRRIDSTVIDALWPLVVSPQFPQRRRRRAQARLLRPLQQTRGAAEGALTDLAVAAAAAAMPASLRDRLAAWLRPGGGVVAGAAVLDWAMAAAFSHPAFVLAVDDILHRRLWREAVLLRPAAPIMSPIRLSGRALIALIAMVRVPRQSFAALTRRSMFERAWNEHAASLWSAGDAPRDFEAWLFTEALWSRGSRMDRRLAVVARSAGLLGCARFATRPAKAQSRPAAAARVTDAGGVDYSTMPEPLARFLRCEF